MFYSLANLNGKLHFVDRILPELHQTTQENRFSYEVTIQCHSPVQSRRRKIQIFPVRRRRRSPGEKTLSIGRCARSGFSHGSVKKRLAKNSRRGKPISRLAHPGSWRHRHRDSVAEVSRHPFVNSTVVVGPVVGRV